YEKEIHATAVTADKATWVGTRKRRYSKDFTGAERFTVADASVACSNMALSPSTRIGWSLKVFLFIAVLAALTAWLTSSVEVPWRTSLGPHLDYVNGPPPV
ncbi:unnamed protein product, partial [Gongylonema pulchrum]|uniref:Serine/threonine protein kinase n=1 Tax=Gongylonema pulchrum TaxID=637853 RepID=A0A183EZT7_9BILA